MEHLTRRRMLQTAALATAFFPKDTPAQTPSPEQAAGATAGTPGEGTQAPATLHKLALLSTAHIHTDSFLHIVAGRPEFKITRLWEDDAARKQKYVESLGAVAAADRKEIWGDPEIEGVIILSETFRHRELVLEAAAAGKHIFVEKPLGVHGQDAAEMAAAIEKAGVLFHTGYNMRGEQTYLFLKEQIEKGAFGRITRVRLSVSNAGSLEGMFDRDYRWMTDPQKAGVGGFGDIGTHALDLLMWYFGEVARVTAALLSASGKPGDGNENGEAILEFKNGITAVLSAGWMDLDNPMPVYIGGTSGYAYKLKDRFYFQSQKVEGADGRRAWTKYPPGRPPALELFLDAVGGQKEIPLVTAREAAARCKVMEAIYQSAREHRWIEIN